MCFLKFAFSCLKIPLWARRISPQQLLQLLEHGWGNDISWNDLCSWIRTEHYWKKTFIFEAFVVREMHDQVKFPWEYQKLSSPFIFLSIRYNKYYVQYYLHWTILLVTGILPLTTLAFLNTRIYLRITEVRKFRTSANSHSK